MTTLNTIAYYERVITSETHGGVHNVGERNEALRRTQEFARLFLRPGVAHCGGGAGPDTPDELSPLVQWVEQGIAPDQLLASKIVNGVTTFTRPLFPTRHCRGTAGRAIRQWLAVSRVSLTLIATTTNRRPRSTSMMAIITRSSRLTTTTPADETIPGRPVETEMRP